MRAAVLHGTFGTEGAPDFEALSWPFAEAPDAFGTEVASGGPL